MRKIALAALAAGAISVAAVAPAEAHWRGGWHGGGWGPGLGFGLAAGALAFGAAAAASHPGYYGPPYGYYGPRYYRPRIFYRPYAWGGYYGPRYYGGWGRPIYAGW